MKRVKIADSLAVVIPVHNREKLVVDTLDSIAAQRYAPQQLIIVDNGSTDGSLRAVQQWADAYIGKFGAASAPDAMQISIISEPKPGACAARNAGLRLVTADWVMFFDSDDLMLPGHIERAMEAARANQQAQIVGWPVSMEGIDGKRSVKPFASADAMFHCVMHGTMATQRWMARTGLVRRAGGWDESVMAWNDIELGIRMLRLLDGPSQIAEVAPGKPTVLVRCQAQSITGTRISATADARCHAIDCIASNLPASVAWIAPMKRMALAALCHREGRKDLSDSILAQALASTPSATRRALLRAAHAYTAIGGRGAARLLRPFF